MKRKPDKKAAIQEKVEELSSEGEEEEEEEEETIQAPPPSKANNSGLQRKKDSKNKSGDNKKEEGDEEENVRLNKEAQAVSRLSNASSMKRSNAKHSQNHTSMTIEDIIPGKSKLTFKEKLIKWFKSKWFSLFMIFVTGWTMISEDLRQLAPKAIDPLFYVFILLI
jgi:hypothetical protein